METMTESDGPLACNCVALRKAARRISAYYDACLAPAELRATQYAILALIDMRGALSVNAIGHALGMDRSTAGQNLRPLERDGLLVLTQSAQDGRARMVSLTSVGEARLHKARPLWDHAQAAFEIANGAASAASLRATLGGLAIPGA